MMARMRGVVNIVNSIKAYNANWDKPDWIETNPEVMSVITNYWALRDEVEHGG